MAITLDSRRGGEPGQEGANKTNADNGDGLAAFDIAATEDVHGAAKRLARKRLTIQFSWQRGNHRGIREVVRGVSVVGQCRDPVAPLEGL